MGLLREADGQVGVGDEELAEGYGVGFALVEELLAGLLIDGFVGDEDSAEDLLEAGADAVGADVFAGGDEGEFALAELAGDVAEGCGGVGVGDTVGVAAWREVHADAARAEDGDGGFGGFEHEAGAVFDGAAVLVGAVVGAVLQELVEEVAVGSVELYAVEACGLGVLCAAAEGFDDSFDLVGFEGAGEWGRGAAGAGG